MFGDLEKAYSVISERPVRRFWRFGENLFDEIVVGDLEKTFGDFGENRSVILYWSSLWSIVMLGDRIWSVSRIETYKVLDVP